ncbi:MAG: hypothetical protein HY291_01735 [Planctomycetes bacterium]|nr:hypothetical protein [Planctomycetota bacterium]
MIARRLPLAGALGLLFFLTPLFAAEPAPPVKEPPKKDDPKKDDPKKEKEEKPKGP